MDILIHCMNVRRVKRKSGLLRPYQPLEAWRSKHVDAAFLFVTRYYGVFEGEAKVGPGLPSCS